MDPRSQSNKEIGLLDISNLALHPKQIMEGVFFLEHFCYSPESLGNSSFCPTLPHAVTIQLIALKTSMLQGLLKPLLFHESPC